MSYSGQRKRKSVWQGFQSKICELVSDKLTPQNVTDNTVVIPANINVGVVYRPPNQNLRDFINSPDSLLASISKENKICYVLGD